MMIKVTEITPDEAYRLFCTDHRVYSELRSLRGRKIKAVRRGRPRPSGSGEGVG